MSPGSIGSASLKIVSRACSRPASRRRALKRCSRFTSQILSTTSLVQIASIASAGFTAATMDARRHRIQLRIRRGAAGAARAGRRGRREMRKAPLQIAAVRSTSLPCLRPRSYGADRRTRSGAIEGRAALAERSVSGKYSVTQFFTDEIGRTKPICYIIHAPLVPSMIPVTPTISLDDSEILETFIRGSGPGGQNVNKVATAVQLRFDVRRSPSLPEEVRLRLERLSGQAPHVGGRARHHGPAAPHAGAQSRGCVEPPPGPHPPGDGKAEAAAADTTDARIEEAPPRGEGAACRGQARKNRQAGLRLSDRRQSPRATPPPSRAGAGG